MIKTAQRQISTLFVRSLRPSRDQSQQGDRQLHAMERRRRLTRLMILGFVIVPTILAIVFYGLIAAKRYASEVRFVVRSLSAPQASGIDLLFRTFGLAKTADDANVIQKYLQSRDAMHDLAAEGVDVRAIFTRPTSDRLSRFPHIWRSDSNESLYDYYLERVLVTEDTVKGIIQMRVIAFQPEDAQLIAQKLLFLAERLVNRMNTRAQQDALETSRTEVSAAEDKVMKSQADITAFRNKEILIDPSKSGLSVIETIGDMSTDLARAQAQLSETLVSSPRNPGLPALRQRIAALQDRIAIEQGRLAGNDSALSNKIATYEQLALRRDIADKTLYSALSALEAARQEALRQHIYVEEIASANLPDESTEPERIRGILTVFVLGFGIFAVLWIVSVGAGEHAQ